MAITNRIVNGHKIVNQLYFTVTTTEQSCPVCEGRTDDRGMAWETACAGQVINRDGNLWVVVNVKSWVNLLTWLFTLVQPIRSRLAFWPNSWQWLQLLNFRFRRPTTTSSTCPPPPSSSTCTVECPSCDRCRHSYQLANSRDVGLTSFLCFYQFRKNIWVFFSYRVKSLYILDYLLLQL